MDSLNKFLIQHSSDTLPDDSVFLAVLRCAGHYAIGRFAMSGHGGFVYPVTHRTDSEAVGAGDKATECEDRSNATGDVDQGISTKGTSFGHPKD